MVLSYMKGANFSQVLNKLFGFVQGYHYLFCYLSEAEVLRNFTLSISHVFDT